MTPTRFSLEHIPKSMSPSGQIDSAPKEFEVYGYVESELEANPEFLGRFTYNIESSPIQFFPVQNHTNKLFRYIELKIISNHGNVNYTCLYRFRVHGAR
jgi:SUN domain-containing protein 1/2